MNDIFIEYPNPKPIMPNIEHIGCGPSHMNGKWEVLAGDVITYNDKTPSRVLVVMERKE